MFIQYFPAHHVSDPGKAPARQHLTYVLVIEPIQRGQFVITPNTNCPVRVQLPPRFNILVGTFVLIADPDNVYGPEDAKLLVLYFRGFFRRNRAIDRLVDIGET